MDLKPVERVKTISKEDFYNRFFKPEIPVIITDLAQQWPAYKKWTWEYIQEKVGDQKVGVYNNIKSDAYTPINTADDYMKFRDYIDLVKKGPVELRIFLFNLFANVPELVQDFNWPEDLLSGFVKKYPMLFIGGQNSVTHIHYDIDMSHILHTQFLGRKKVLLFPYHEKEKLYHMPFTVLSAINFAHYDKDLDEEKYSALKKAQGYETILSHGETLFMPGGFFHHMEYIEPGMAMSLRVIQKSLLGKLDGAYKIFLMRGIDTLLKKTIPLAWHNWKTHRAYTNAAKYETSRKG